MKTEKEDEDKKGGEGAGEDEQVCGRLVQDFVIWMCENFLTGWYGASDSAQDLVLPFA
ncbi:hypothetical protein GCM10010885_19600 [Alicyclobacillus cellulosilyticus]|uniref:Uncharacterized protein n=1 Tax=Alicyclobacillus cellulosilyticus TaxID=1003997 RepID=A0A917NN69_9BACL|nr:hypothetical protein GCM10010885_19600 [Alicyclobacillus cellulosilyticus]